MWTVSPLLRLYVTGVPFVAEATPPAPVMSVVGSTVMLVLSCCAMRSMPGGNSVSASAIVTAT